MNVPCFKLETGITLSVIRWFFRITATTQSNLSPLLNLIKFHVYLVEIEIYQLPSLSISGISARPTAACLSTQDWVSIHMPRYIENSYSRNWEYCIYGNQLASITRNSSSSSRNQVWIINCPTCCIIVNLKPKALGCHWGFGGIRRSNNR